MPTASSLLLLGLASLFVFAAVAKLLDRAGTRSTLEAFGVPEALRAPLALALPAGELALAFALLVPPLGRMAAAAAAGVLAGFGAVLAYQVVRGRSLSCNCFGRTAARPIGWGTVARNALLAAAGAAAAWGPSARLLEGLAMPVPVGSLALAGGVALAACYASLRR
ncbi:MAG TPA: MauE/DoxX family redox-associated membrane protein, partial [Longimicrobium sp.]|nr:MauE/DoxX family redox-associated membrane protein [Longimicrobium sp.]